MCLMEFTSESIHSHTETFTHCDLGEGRADARMAVEDKCLSSPQEKSFNASS